MGLTWRCRSEEVGMYGVRHERLFAWIRARGGAQRPLTPLLDGMRTSLMAVFAEVAGYPTAHTSGAST